MISNADTQALAWREHCKDCGAIFELDQLEIGPLRFRLNLTIENTGEHGALGLALDSSRVFILDKTTAPRWIESYAWQRAQNRTAWDIYEHARMGHALRPLDPASLPRELAPGERWSGWFEVAGRRLTEDDVGMVGIFGPFRRESPVGYMNHVTHDKTHPFIGLNGEVTIKPLSPFAAATAGLLAQLRCVWAYRYVIAGTLVGVVAGAAIDSALGTRPLFGLGSIVGGAFAGYHLTQFLQRRRPVRPDL